MGEGGGGRAACVCHTQRVYTCEFLSRGREVTVQPF